MFTDCDQLSAFNSITKDRVYKQLMNLKQDGNSSIITALSSLGESEVPSIELKLSLEKLTVMLYSSKRKDLTTRYSELHDVGILRWELHSKFAEDSCALPPTPAALREHILRANYITLAWKRYIIILNPPLPSLIGNGWDENLAPVMTDELPALNFPWNSLSANVKNLSVQTISVLVMRISFLALRRVSAIPARMNHQVLKS